MLSGQTHTALEMPTSWRAPCVLSSLTDPSTFEGGVAAAVVGGLVVAIFVAVVGVLRRRRRRSAMQSAEVKSQPRSTGSDEYVADLVTGIGQALMGVREAVELFSKGVLLEDPETQELEENSREVLVEAYRRVEEAEARLPRGAACSRRSGGRRQASGGRVALFSYSPQRLRPPAWLGRGVELC